MPNVAFIRNELKNKLASYYLIRDCIEGEQKIKAGKTKYLPMPNASDTSIENQTRYKAYVERAVFYNVTQRTLEGLVGQVFAKPAEIEISPILDTVKDDANGSGISLEQVAKRALSLNVSFGRAGVLVDYPATDTPASRADIINGDIRPTIETYNPWDIINWRTIARGAKEILSLVVLHEDFVYSDDGFEMKTGEQWRVLRLENDLTYKVEVWRKGEADFSIVEQYYPKDSTGNYIREIPFTFIGSKNNDSEIDEAPLYSIASLNIAHYRNSADYEESCFMVGQPTPIFTGLTEAWVKNVLDGVIALGSRGSIPLPVGASASLLQAEPNSMPMEAMTAKERQMVALGAKLVEQAQVQRTATEAGLENASESSILASCTNNVSAAIKWALEWCGVFVGNFEPVIFKLNSEFNVNVYDAQIAVAKQGEVSLGLTAKADYRSWLRKVGQLDPERTDEMIDSEAEVEII